MMWWRDICFIPRSNESIKVLRGGDSEEALALLSASLRQELEGLVDGLRRLEGIAPTLAPAALRKLAEGLEQLEAAVRADNASE